MFFQNITVNLRNNVLYGSLTHCNDIISIFVKFIVLMISRKIHVSLMLPVFFFTVLLFFIKYVQQQIQYLNKIFRDNDIKVASF